MENHVLLSIKRLIAFQLNHNSNLELILKNRSIMLEYNVCVNTWLLIIILGEQ